MGLKTISEQFREDLMRTNLQTPPDVVVGLSDLGGSLSYSAYRDALGKDAAIHRFSVNDPGNILDVSSKIREYLFKRNLQTPSDIEEAIIDLSANQSETIRNMGSIGTDATINWRSVVVDVGTLDNAADVTRLANFSRNKQRDLTDPSESNLSVKGDSYNYISLLQDIGQPAIINNFEIRNLQSISSPENKINDEARKLDLKINRYTPEEFTSATIRENILNEVYKHTTYVTDYTATLKDFNPQEYNYFTFYNQNPQVSIPQLLSQETTLIEEDTTLMNIAAYMLNFNLQQRFEQNLYTETLGRLNLYRQNYQSQFPPSLDPLDLIRIAKDPMDNIYEKNFTITVPRNFVSKTAQFLLGLEGIVSPFDLWESVDTFGNDLTPNCFVSNEGLKALDPTTQVAANSDTNVVKVPEPTTREQDDDALLKKTGGGQRWALYENINMNKYSPKFDTPAEMIGFTNKPKGIYYLGSEETPPIDILQVQPGVSIINNNALIAAFNKGYDDPDHDIVWSNPYDSAASDLTDTAGFVAYVADMTANRKSTGYKFRECSLMDTTQKLLYVGGVDSPIRNLKTKFRDGNLVYSKGNATKKIDIIHLTDGRHKYIPTDPWKDGFCRTWTKGKQYGSIASLVRYGELIRRERNSVIDRNGNYNIFPSRLNVGTLYDQQMLAKDGVRDRFADKNFDKVRARKYMFSIENLAWKDSDEYNNLPPYEQGPSGGRIMWFPPYGLTFNETSTANWTKHDFLGRPEPIYTYNNTERSGNLSWLVVVDHPTILNLLVQKELAGLSDQQVDDVLAAFFAGCVDYDIFELARIWGVFTNDDIAFFKDVLNGNYKYPVNVTSKKQEQIIREAQAQTIVKPDDGKGNEIKTALEDLLIFFPNDVPAIGTTTNYGKDIYPDYLGWIKNTVPSPTNSSGCVYDYCNTIGALAPIQYFLGGEGGIDITAEYEKCNTALSSLSNYLKVLPDDKQVDITVKAYASSLASDDYNKKLAKRRAFSVVKWFAETLGLTIDETETTDTSFDVKLTGGQNTNRVLVRMHGDYDKDFNERSVDNMYADVSWGQGFDNTKPIYWAGAGVDGVTGYESTVFESSTCTNKYYSILSYPACYARRVELVVDTPQIEKTETTETITEKVIPKEGITYEESAITFSNIVNKRDIATRILNKLIGENEYFDYLRADSPTVFESLADKLKYFSPAFHSMTPEGLNARLTFLQQCIRPGNTIGVKTSKNDIKPKDSTSNVVNMSFGRPPICILRIGDFYNTKMIIENLVIDYANANGNVTYDLNPEGIGVQPMIAKVSATVKYVGGAGLREPVSRLQNALSFNYYANADIYETQSFGQTDIDERYLENLELAYDSTELDIAGMDLTAYEKINYKPVDNFSHLGKIENPDLYPQISSTMSGYTADHRIKDGIDIVQYYELNYQDLFKNTYESYTTYMKSYTETMDKLVSADLPYDFMWFLYSGMVGSPNFNSKSDDSYFKSTDYPYITGKTTSFAHSNYFTIDYDAFQKSGNIATTKLHLYPQRRNRIVDVATFNIQDFGGIALPRAFDIDYMKRYLDPFRQQFIKYLNCEEWLLFAYEVTKAFDALDLITQNSFRSYVEMKFNEYYDGLWNNYLKDIDTNYDTFVKFYQNVLATNSVCSGIDGGTSSAGVRYLEVVPDQNSPSGTDFTTIFGSTCDIFNEFPYPIDMTGKQSFKDVYALSNTGERGDFNYLSKQLSSTLWQSEGLHYYDFSAGKWMLNGSPAASGVTATTVFEKLNYERLYFGNLTVQSFIEDTFAQTSKEFTKKVVKKDFSNYTDARKNWVRLALGLDSAATEYDMNVFDYTGTTNSVFSRSQNITTMQVCSLENILFFGFMGNFRQAGFITGIKDYLYTLHPDPKDTYDKQQRAKIDNFLAKLSSSANGVVYTSLASSIRVYITEAAKLVTESKTGIDAVLAVVNKGAENANGYRMKMFELADNRTNTAGRLALQAYLRFKTDYPIGT